MNVQKRRRIVLLGMLTKLRVAGAMWQVLHYLVGFRRLGYEVFYVEDHGSQQWAFGTNERQAAAFLSRLLATFGFAEHWAFRARAGSGRSYGLSDFQLKHLYATADVVLNLHCGTVPNAEQAAANCLVGIDTDPVELQVKLHHGTPAARGLLAQHAALFTFGECYGSARCKVPISNEFAFRATRQPVVLDFWEARGLANSGTFTTVGNWQQGRRVLEYNGEEYNWSKHFQFLKFIELPHASSARLELALSKCDVDDRETLRRHGWAIRDAVFSLDLTRYREYIRRSKGEFTVAKEQNIRMRSGWFSDRSASYLGAGRPVITQETGFSEILPTGRGLFAFSTQEEIISALDAIESNYDSHRAAAKDIAREYFSYDVVLGRMLSDLGLPASRHPSFASQPDRRRSLVKRGFQGAINLIASASPGTGLDATARRYARVFANLGLGVNLVDVSDLARRPSLPAHPGEVNVICTDLARYFDVLQYLGQDLFRNRYNIGLWLWELSSFPERWYDRFGCCDEVWTPSAFLASVFAPLAPVPVVRIPHVLTFEAKGSRSRGRSRLGLRPQDFACAFVFDFHSSVERKNPQGVIDAFKRAFNPHQPVRLIIKCRNARFNSGAFEEMQKQAAGYPIDIYDQAWPASDIRDLTAACDCYVSLHRAEGVGLTISDAMAIGKPAVATGWSGNMDYMTISNSFPVRFKLAAIESNVGQYTAGEQWAEPSLEHAAECMRYVFEHRKEAALIGQIARHEIAAAYSEAAVATIVASRLSVIANWRKHQLLRQHFRRSSSGLPMAIEELEGLGHYIPRRYLAELDVKRHLRAVVKSRLRQDAPVAVAAKGDDLLLNALGTQAVHFPQASNGFYAGHHPANSGEAIRNLEETRAKGVEYLLFPSTSFWWFDYYLEFRDYLRDHHTLAYEDNACRIFELRGETARMRPCG
jgi:glycosyltransferase involved in cell wall biosynthesis